MIICVTDSYMDIIHYSGNVPLALTIQGIAKVQEDRIYFNSNHKFLDFKRDICLIIKQGYPCNDNEKREAIKRARSRLGEADYKVASNNCEYFVTWALTGKAECDQFDKAGVIDRVIVDSIDATLCNYRSGTLKTATKHGLHSGGIAVEKMVSEQVLKRGSSLLIKSAASNSAKAGSAVVASSLAALPVEAAFFGYEIHKLRKRYKKGAMTEQNFKREVVKNVGGSVGAVGAGIGGAVIGQIAIPVPVLGGIIGGFIGSLAGRLVGTVAPAAVFDQI